MSSPQTAHWNRRQFLGGLTLAGTVGLLGIKGLKKEMKG